MMPADALVVGVTGANGFVGRALCAELEARGHVVRPLLRSDGNKLDARAEVVGDIGPDTEWRKALHGLDCVVHCAAHVHQIGSHVHTTASTYQRVNTAGTERLAQCAADADVRRLVFISTIKVLGERTSPGEPFRHDSPPCPTDPYGVSKWEGEQALHRVAAKTGLETVVIRPPLVYGPGVGANFAALIRWVRSGWPLPLGSVDNRRSMVGLRNLVDLICRCASQPEAAGHTFLISDNDDLSTAGLAQRLAQATQSPVRLWPIPVPLLHLAGKLTGKSAQVTRLTESLQVDISQTCNVLEWHPPHTVEEELMWTVQGKPS